MEIILAHNTPVGKSLMDRILVDKKKKTVDRIPKDRILVDKTPVDKSLMDRILVDKTPVDRILMDRFLVDKTPVDDGK